MTGTLVNVVAVLIGAALGSLILRGMPEKIVATVTAGVALAVVVIGIDSAMTDHSPLITIISLAVGGGIGEMANIDGRLQSFASRFRGGEGGSHVGEAALTATLIFCVGPMAILGAIQGGLLGEHSTLYAKSLLDGITATVLASTLGPGVALSAGAVLLYQGGIALSASALSVLLTDVAIAHLTAVGGALIVALGFNMLEMTEIRVANFLPAIAIAPALAVLVPGLVG
ncbi:MAG: DUF554 domain-containing protein [Bacillota bacterium]